MEIKYKQLNFKIILLSDVFWPCSDTGTAFRIVLNTASMRTQFRTALIAQHDLYSWAGAVYFIHYSQLAAVIQQGQYMPYLTVMEKDDVYLGIKTIQKRELYSASILKSQVAFGAWFCV